MAGFRIVTMAFQSPYGEIGTLISTIIVIFSIWLKFQSPYGEIGTLILVCLPIALWQLYRFQSPYGEIGTLIRPCIQI